ncbi:unnamed protein product, partial [Ectocarpus sp. 13 AM-2016]
FVLANGNPQSWLNTACRRLLPSTFVLVLAHGTFSGSCVCATWISPRRYIVPSRLVFVAQFSLVLAVDVVFLASPYSSIGTFPGICAIFRFGSPQYLSDLLYLGPRDSGHCTYVEIPRCHTPTSRAANTFLASRDTSSLTPRLGQYLLLVINISLQYSKTITESLGIL